MKNATKVISLIKKEFRDSKKPTIRRTSEKRDPFKTLIACLLSLRTRDENTAKTSSSLFKVADTPEKILRLPIKKLEKLIFSSGFYKNKARTIKHVSRVLIEKYNSKVPPNIDKLMEIKGIGRKTATICMVYGFNKPDYIPTDVHVHQIANRLGWVKTKTPEKTELELMKSVPKKYWYELNTLFVLFGKKICVSISPFCSKCPVRKYCKRVGVKRNR